MKSNRSYLPGSASFPANGLNTAVPSTMLSPQNTPATRNINYRRGNLKKRSGYKTIGGTVSGTVMEIIKFEVSQGVVKTVLITTTREYVLVDNAWVNITHPDGDRTGDVNDLIDYVVATDINGTWLYITNGIEPVRKWDGSTSNFEDSGIDIPLFVTCKALAVYNGSLILGNLDLTEPKSIAWSDTGDFTKWTVGNADADLLYDADGEIVRMIPLSSQLVVYTTNSIVSVQYIGGQQQYSIVKTIDGTRLLSPRAIINLSAFHVYMSQENIRLFDGSRQEIPLADAVQDDYRKDLYLDQAQRAFAFYDGIETTAVFGVPTVDGGISVYTMELQLLSFYQPQTARWSIYDLAHDPKTMGYYTLDQTLLWSSAAMAVPWSQLTFRWNDVSTKKGFPLLVFGSGSQVYVFDATTGTDAGQVIFSFVDTLDFTVPNSYTSEFGRWIEVEMELKGSSCLVQYSTDQGGTWTNFPGSDADMVAGVQTLTSNFKNYRFFVDTVAKYFRVRVATTTIQQYFERRHFKLWVQPAGAN